MAQWLPVVGFEGVYEVSDAGEVRRVKQCRGAVAGRVLRPTVRPDGYLAVGLHDIARKTPFRPHLVHRLVAAAFVGPQPPGHEVNHINAVRDDDRAVNLEWVTRRGNVEHCIRLGRANRARGIAHPRAKLSEDDVRTIRASRESALSLARRLGVNGTVTAKIRRREAWTHVK